MFGSRIPSSEEAPARFLPFDVRYALRYRDAELNGQEIGALFRNQFPELGFYLVMKANDDNDTVQRSLLELAAGREPGISDLSQEDVAFALEDADNTTVKATKIASISRYGVPNWLDSIDRTLEHELSELPPDTPTFVVANAPFAGLDAIMRRTVRRGAALGILKPSRFGEADQPVGFMLQPVDDNVTVEPLAQDFERPAPALLFDDTIRSGKTLAKAAGFWCVNGAEAPHTASITQVSDTL